MQVRNVVRGIRLALAAVALIGPMAMIAHADEAAPAKPGTPPLAMQQDRLLTCRIGHITNFDPSIEQTPDQLRFDSMHDFSMFLPAIPVQVGRPPDATEAGPPVDPRTRIVADPDHISGQPDNRFTRIVDLWPDRVELSAVIDGPLLNAIVINPIDTKSGVASLFMLRASELTHYQADHMYQGTCRIMIGDMARAALRPSS